MRQSSATLSTRLHDSERAVDISRSNGWSQSRISKGCSSRFAKSKLHPRRFQLLTTARGSRTKRTTSLSKRRANHSTEKTACGSLTSGRLPRLPAQSRHDLKVQRRSVRLRHRLSSCASGYCNLSAAASAGRKSSSFSNVTYVYQWSTGTRNEPGE